MKEYLRAEMVVKAVQWGSVWEENAETAKWLGENGISLIFDKEGKHAEASDDYTLPQLFVFTNRWDRLDVRVGDYIVVKGYREVVIVDKNEFRKEYSEIESC